jgi:hypothetical protein
LEGKFLQNYWFTFGLICAPGLLQICVSTVLKSINQHLKNLNILSNVLSYMDDIATGADNLDDLKKSQSVNKTQMEQSHLPLQDPKTSVSDSSGPTVLYGLNWFVATLTIFL